MLSELHKIIFKAFDHFGVATSGGEIGIQASKATGHGRLPWPQQCLQACL
jgi:hypothetical protein